MGNLHILAAARNLIINKENWVQGVSARTKEYVYTSAVNEYAEKFCAVGALMHVTGSVEREVIEPLAALLTDGQPFYSRCMMFLTHLNDTHTHETVIALFDAAINREIRMQGGERSETREGGGPRPREEVRNLVHASDRL